MAFDRADVRGLIDANLGSHGTPDHAGGIEEPDFDKLVDDAVSYYSRLRPDTSIHDVSGDGSTYDFSLPSDWEDGFSSILSAEYPQGSRIPTFLDINQVTIYQDTAADVIRLLTTTPSSGETVRFVYTHSRVVDNDSGNTTVADQDMEAIGHLATYYTAIRLAAEMAKVVRSSQQDDPLGLRSESGEYLAVARRHWELFASHMGIAVDGPGIVAASGQALLTNRMSWGRKPLTHGDDSSRFYRR